MCNTIVFDDSRPQTAPGTGIRVRTLKGLAETKRMIQSNANANPANTEVSTQERAKKLEAENRALKQKLDSMGEVERRCKAMTRRCMELEEENMMLKRRISFLIGPEDGKKASPEEEEKEEEKETPTAGKEADENMNGESGDEDLEGLEDEGIRRAMKDNRQKMGALRREVRLLVAQSSPGMTVVHAKKQRKKGSRPAEYDYSEDIK